VIVINTLPELLPGLCLLVYTSACQRIMSNIFILFVALVLFFAKQLTPPIDEGFSVSELNEGHNR
jgi:hypothetical protein